MSMGISVTCFAASYAVTLFLEVSRLFFRAPIRIAIMVGFAAAGLVAHTIYLGMLARSQLGGAPLSSWYDWCLLAAWVLAASYLMFVIRQPQNSVGLFLLPLVLALIGIAVAVHEMAPFARAQALDYWRSIHAVTLLMGTVTVSLGFAAGVMYLVQSYRLKHKLPPRPGFKLPALEMLQRLNTQSLWISTGLLALGLLSGIILNAIRHADAARYGIPWSDPVILSSAVLFVWLLIVAIFEWFYKPARQGRKVAYLTLASFVFLALALGFVLLGRHASGPSAEPLLEGPVPLTTLASAADRTADRQGGAA